MIDTRNFSINQNNKVMKKFNEMEISEIAKLIVGKFALLNGARYFGVREYENDYKELANYVLIADFKWIKAVNTSIEILKSLSDADFTDMVERYKACNEAGIRYSNLAQGKLYLETGKIPKEGTDARKKVLESIKTTKTLSGVRDEMINTLVANLDPNTRSKQSEAQIEAYERVLDDEGNIVPSIKIHKVAKSVHIYAMANSKKVLKEGEYKNGEKRLETIQKDAIEKYCKYVLKDSEGKARELPITKYRNLVLHEDKMCSVALQGEEIVLV